MTNSSRTGRSNNTRPTRRHQEEESWLLLAAFAAAAVAVSAGSLWLWRRLFRRPCRPLAHSDLPPPVAADGIEVASDNALRSAEERLAVKEAFLAGDDFRYLAAGKDYKTIDDCVNRQQQHRAVAFGMVEYFVAFCEQYGHVLVCRDREDNGTFLGAIGLIPPYRSRTLFTLHFYRTILPYGWPAPLNMGEEIAARFSAFSVMSQLHEDCTKTVPQHWYVQFIAVSPKAQGKGVGTKLMKAAMALAGNNLPMYLECHNDNVPYYERFGFKVEKMIEIVPKGINDTTTFQMNGMVRAGL